MDAVVIAVSHKQFAEMNLKDFDAMFKNTDNKNKVLVDIKGILNREEAETAGYSYWRL